MQTYHKITSLSKLFIIILIVISILYIILNYRSSDTPIKNSSVNTQAQVTVTNSVFSSIGDNSYKILAERVTQNKDGVYFLDTISGAYYLDNADEVKMQAHYGHFDSVLDIVKLENDVKVTYLGYDLISDVMNLDLKRYSASGQNSVHVKGASGSIDADTFKTTDKFNQITFTGNVSADFVIHDKHQ
jgi:LPS export ABC transporter protein LptC